MSSLSLDECKKYEVIFKGRIESIKECQNTPGEAVFIVDELYKGNATKRFKVLFDCNVDCAMQMNVGDEWIIYSNYKQLTNVELDWCSRSRKYIKAAEQDFYTINYGNDYLTEVKFLRENLGLHRLVAETKNVAENRNQRPSMTQSILLISISFGAIILFYWLLNKFFKSKG